MFYFFYATAVNATQLLIYLYLAVGVLQYLAFRLLSGKRYPRTIKAIQAESGGSAWKHHLGLAFTCIFLWVWVLRTSYLRRQREAQEVTKQSKNNSYGR